MVNLPAVRNTQLTRLQTTQRAAQYVRMSTDYQRYSIENQAATIASYAAQHNLTIVRTYSDKGRSGLRITVLALPSIASLLSKAWLSPSWEQWPQPIMP